MPSKVTLYFTAGSPPARAVLLLARYLKVDVELKQVDLRAGEQKTESFAKLNPQGKVPVLVDGDFVLSESRAILAYLVNSRKPGSDLYPTDPKARALVDHRLYYDATSIFDKLIALVRPAIYEGATTIPQKHKDDVWGVYKAVNEFLSGKEYVAGNHLTIADFSIVTTISSFYEMGYEMSDYSNLKKWYGKIQSLPHFEENENGAKYLAGAMKGLVKESLF